MFFDFVCFSINVRLRANKTSSLFFSMRIFHATSFVISLNPDQYIRGENPINYFLILGHQKTHPKLCYHNNFTSQLPTTIL